MLTVKKFLNWIRSHQLCHWPNGADRTAGTSSAAGRIDDADCGYDDADCGYDDADCGCDDVVRFRLVEGAAVLIEGAAVAHRTDGADAADAHRADGADPVAGCRLFQRFHGGADAFRRCIQRPHLLQGWSVDTLIRWMDGTE